MKIYRCTLKILTPTILGNVRDARGVYTASHVIPGHTVGGAINRELIEKHGVSERNTAKMLISSPAYPVFNNLETLPAHPFYYECKVCDNLRFSTLEKESLLNALNGGLDGVKESIIALSCEKGHLLRSLHPKPVVRSETRTVSERVLVQTFISVGMNRNTAASQYGLLYEYTAVEPGQEYWFTLASVDDDEVPDKFEVKIGRGISRGFGRALVRVVERDLKFSYRHTTETTLMMYALSPVPLRYLSNPINLRECANRYGLQGINGSLKPVIAFGKVETVLLGWPRSSPFSRERVACLSAGSILVCEWKEMSSELVKSLEVLRYLGVPLALGSGPVDGLCMLSPFVKEPLKEVR